jgi:hypothetical protein
MPPVPRFGISHMPVSREFAREWQFNGLATIRQLALISFLSMSALAIWHHPRGAPFAQFSQDC